MPEKINFNKSQKDKERKILNYYRKNLKSTSISIKEVPKPIKKTKKVHPNLNQDKQMQMHTQTHKLTKIHPEDDKKDDKKDETKDKKIEKTNKPIVNMD